MAAEGARDGARAVVPYIIDITRRR